MPTTQETELRRSLEKIIWKHYGSTNLSLDAEGMLDEMMPLIALSHQALLKEKREEVERLPIYLVGTHPLNPLKSVDEAVARHRVLALLTPTGDKQT